MNTTTRKTYELVKAIGLDKLEAAINERLANGATLSPAPATVVFAD